MILFDGTHLTSDTSFEELMQFARKLNLHIAWLQESNSGLIHFDLWGKPKLKVEVNCSGKDIVRRGIRRHG